MLTPVCSTYYILILVHISTADHMDVALLINVHGYTVVAQYALPPLNRHTSTAPVTTINHVSDSLCLLLVIPKRKGSAYLVHATLAE